MTPKQAWGIIKPAIDLRRKPGLVRDPTDGQLKAVNATLADVLLDKRDRLPVLRVLLQYPDAELDSSTDLTFADAHAILSAAYPGAAQPGVDEPDAGFVALVRRAEREALKRSGQMELF